VPTFVHVPDALTQQPFVTGKFPCCGWCMGFVCLLYVHYLDFLGCHGISACAIGEAHCPHQPQATSKCTTIQSWQNDIYFNFWLVLYWRRSCVYCLYSRGPCTVQSSKIGAKVSVADLTAATRQPELGLCANGS
jgi:hypothetical protein